MGQSVLQVYRTKLVSIVQRNNSNYMTQKQKAYYANAKLIKLTLLKKKTKIKIYKTPIKPVVTYSSETWTLRAKDEYNLCIFERQIQRRYLVL